MNHNKISKNFIIFWFGQLISSLGSSMTGFAITIWAYTKTQSALVLSLSTISLLLPQMLVGVFAGPVIEKLDKKAVLLVTDLGAGVCSLALFLLMRSGSLAIWHIYALNVVTSLLGSFQSPAGDVAVSLMVPKKHYTKASGMQSLASGTVGMLAPAFAAAVLAFAGMSGVFLLDLFSLVFASVTLLLFVTIPEVQGKKRLRFHLSSYTADLKEGFRILRGSKLLLTMLFFFAGINFFAGMTYYSLLSPMVLARTGNNSAALAWVNSAIGVGGILGGIFVSLLPSPQNKVGIIFACSGFSFLVGDVLFAVGRTPGVWVVAAFLSSMVLPILNANESYLWRTGIPIEAQGRVFAFRYTLQSGMTPIGVLLGGVLADYVFEPYLVGNTNFFSHLLGNTSGSGMAMMFLLTGIVGALISAKGFSSKKLRHWEKKLLEE